MIYNKATNVKYYNDKKYINQKNGIEKRRFQSINFYTDFKL